MHRPHPGRGLAAALLLLAPACFAGCPSPSWQASTDEAAAVVAASPEDPTALARAGELALLVDRDPERANALLERACDRADAASAAGQRAALALAYLAEVTAHPARVADRLAVALAAAPDPLYAEALARSTAALWGQVEGAHAADSPVVRALTTLSEHRGATWEPARAEAGRQLVAAARLRGPAAGVAAAEAAGYLLDWRLSAPWGDVPELDLVRPLGPESRPLADAEDTGHGYAPTPLPTWRGRFSDGEATFFDLDNDAGVGFAEATVELGPSATSREVVLRVEANRSLRVFANGDLVLDLDRFREAGPYEGQIGLVLPAGPLRLTVKLATADGRGFFLARLGARDGGALGLRPASPGAATAPITTFAAPLGLAEAVVRIAPGDGAAATLALAALDAHMERPRRDIDAARALLTRLRAALPGHPALELEAARLALLDPRLPDAEKRRATRDAWEATLAAWPDNLAALRGLAALESQEDRVDGALTYLRRAIEAHPDDPFTALDLARHDRARGWEAEALTLARGLAGAITRSPRIGEELADLYGAYGYLVQARAAADQLEAAFPGAGTTRLADLDGAAGDQHARARRLLAAFAVQPERHELLRGAVQALRAAGDLAAAKDAVVLFLGGRPQDAWGLAERVRIELQGGDRPAALAAIDAALAVHPDFAPMESLSAWLAGRPEALDAIGDGRAIVSHWVTGGAPDRRAEYAGYPVVTLFEHRVLDVRGDGSTLELVHRVHLVQTRSGADSLGDFKPPRGARLLAARTLKADGRVLWPERTRGKEALSFPELEAGDAIETAWVERSQVHLRDGGYLSAVVFGAWDVPTIELHAEVRAAAGLTIGWHAFGGAPAPNVALRDASGERLSWDADAIPAVPREPLAIGARSFFPFVDLTVRASGADDAASWRAVAASYAGRLVRLSRSGPAASALAAELGRAGAGWRARAAAAFAWVRDELDDSERFNGFESPVEVAVAQKKGSRVLVLRALATALEVPAELLLCAPERDGTPEDVDAPTPNPNRFFYPVLRLGLGPEAVLVDPSRPLAPFAALPFELDGARCLAFERAADGAAPLFERLPEASEADAARASWRFDAELAIGADGAAHGVLAGRGWGPSTAGLRHAWSNADDARRRLIWQQWAATLVSGASVQQDAVDGAETPDVAIGWRLRLAADGVAVPDGDGLVVSGLLKPLAGSDLAAVPELAQLVSLPTRRTPLRLVPHRETTRIALQAPPGYVWGATPPALDLRHGAHRFTQEVRVDGPRLEVVRTVLLRPERIDPADYPAFRARIQEVVQAFEARARLVPAGR